jgi:putative peptidoglycan lipid II flippase
MGETPSVRDAVSRGLGLMMLLNLPATVGLVMLADPIVRVLFERGQFRAIDTEATAAALRMYALGLIGYSTARIAAPVFYALGRSRVAVSISVGAVAFNIVAGVLLVRWLGFRGLALATSLAALAHGGVALMALRRFLGGIDGRTLARKFAKVTAAAAAMAIVVAAADRSAASILPGTSLMLQSARLGAAIVSGLCALAIAARALRIPELDELRALARSGVASRPDRQA